jgi:hypothetical protein
MLPEPIAYLATHRCVPDPAGSTLLLRFEVPNWNLKVATLSGSASMPSGQSFIPTERIERLILLIRGHKVLLDEDLAALYRVETKALVRAVKRNLDRFPEDFMFQLTKEEFENLRYQFGTSSLWGGRRYPPYAFTEHGVAMLSSVLNSAPAIHVNVEIMRTFVRLRQMLASNADLSRRLNELEKKYDAQFRVVFDASRQLMTPPEAPKKGRIGFHMNEENRHDPNAKPPGPPAAGRGGR